VCWIFGLKMIPIPDVVDDLMEVTVILASKGEHVMGERGGQSIHVSAITNCARSKSHDCYLVRLFCRD
jgi:hypothetical protein